MCYVSDHEFFPLFCFWLCFLISSMLSLDHVSSLRLSMYFILCLPLALCYSVCVLLCDNLCGFHCRKDVCDINGPGNYTICPLCDNLCGFQKLHDSCIYARLTHVFDNYATVALAVFMAAWGESL